MILLTAKGSFEKSFSNQYKCKTISLRSADVDTFSKAIREARVIIHNGANINCNNVIDCVTDNFVLTKKLLDYIYEINPKAYFIYLSSMSILNTMNENEYENITKMTPYAYSKYLAEIYCLKHPFSSNVSIVRFSTIFYGDEKKDGLSKLINDACKFKKVAIYNKGKAKRDFIPIDIASQYVYEIAQSKKREKIYNIVSAKSTSFSHVVTYLKRKIPKLGVVDEKLFNSVNILNKFSNKSINTLGKINFSLEDKIDLFIKKINIGL